VPAFVISTAALNSDEWETALLSDGHLSVHCRAAGFTMRLSVVDAALLRDQLTALLDRDPKDPTP
jgi:hypothetical protein